LERKVPAGLSAVGLQPASGFVPFRFRMKRERESRFLIFYNYNEEAGNRHHHQHWSASDFTYTSEKASEQNRTADLRFTKPISAILINLEIVAQNSAKPSQTTLCTFLTIAGFSVWYRLFWNVHVTNTSQTCEGSAKAGPSPCVRFNNHSKSIMISWRKYWR
jgi:hypothetical protein